MVRFFSRGKEQAAAPPPVPAFVAAEFDLFGAVWPLPVRLVAFTPTFEHAFLPENKSHAEIVGLLMLTDDLVVFHTGEVERAVPWVTPLARVTGWAFLKDRDTLFTRCGHPNERGEYMNAYWRIPVAINGPIDPYAVRLRDVFIEQMSARVPKRAPTEEELWPHTGEPGVGTWWVPTVVDRAAAGPYPPLGQLLGDHRRESRMPVEVTFKGQRDAAAAYQLAIDSGDADMAPKAALNLGMLRAGQGDPAGAGAAFQLAIDSGHADMAPKAALNLGLLRAEHGDPAGAAAAFQLAIDSGHADVAALAREELGHL
jgi:hypothetical protein